VKWLTVTDFQFTEVGQQFEYVGILYGESE